MPAANGKEKILNESSRHNRGKVEHINRLGLVLTFEGADTSRKPLLFMAHQDVVPIDDPSDWTYPPFAGVFDG